jgi:hypothetical protein
MPWLPWLRPVFAAAYFWNFYLGLLPFMVAGGRCLVAERGQCLPGPRRVGLRLCTLVNFMDVRSSNPFLRNQGSQAQP